ncbi:unnamed protein product, partial [Meganyctiphanes norvegica]
MELLPLTANQRVICILLLNVLYCCILIYIRYYEVLHAIIVGDTILQDKAEQSRNSKDLYGNETEVIVPLPADVLELEVSMNASGVVLHVNRNMVYKDINRTMPWGKRRERLHAGVHVVILHQLTGALMRAESFMTWQPSNHLMLATMLKTINDGRLCLLIGVPEFTMHLKLDTMRVIQDLGSSFIEKVTLKDAWFMVIKKGEKSLHEAIVTSKQPGGNLTFKEVSPLKVHVTLQKSSEDVECNWYKTAGMEQHAAFCNSYGGYGSFCSCHQPWMSTPAVSYVMHEKIPIAIVTAKRLPNVLRQIDSIRNSPGGWETPIAIYVDGINHEAQELGEILHIPVFFHQRNGPHGAPVNVKIAQHMAFTLEHVFQLFPEVDKAIILEDDLQLAPDFIPFFQQTASILDGDPNLLCVNAYNYNSFNHTSYDPIRLYRVHSVPAYGWMVRRTWAKKMLDIWPNATQDVDWDLYVRNTGFLGNWDIIIPEVPRTKHRNGRCEVPGTGIQQDKFSGFLTFRTNQEVEAIPSGSAVSDAQIYYEHHMNIIDNAIVVNITQHPCEVNPLPTYKTNESYVIYMNQPHEGSPTYFVLAHCLGINERDAHESLELMFTFPFYGNQVYLIACPNSRSPFCYTKDTSVIYDGNKDDLAYARQHPLRTNGYGLSYYVRVPAESVEQEVNLMNLLEIVLS